MPAGGEGYETQQVLPHERTRARRQGSRGRKEPAREALHTWGWPAGLGKGDQPWCPSARQGAWAGGHPSSTEGHKALHDFQIWQHTSPATQSWTAPQPHHAKSHPKPGKKPGHHCNSQWRKLLSWVGKSRGRCCCQGKADGARLAFLGQAARSMSHHLQPYSTFPPQRNRSKDDPFLTWAHHQPM